MFLRMKLKKQIKKSKNIIAALEQKRSRSQAELVSALLKHETPKDEDVDYFNHFSERIEAERERMHAWMEEYDALSAKKMKKF